RANACSLKALPITDMPNFFEILEPILSASLFKLAKNPTAKFKPIDYVVVRGKRVQCDLTAINVVLECTTRMEDDYHHKIRTTTLENMKKWFVVMI
ncbi:hypothetical protein H5410_050891, partial [Solanum commersonii]